MSLILDLLSIANAIHDKKARELVRAAALRLARLDWDAEAPAASPQRRAPVILPITPSPAGRAGGAHSRSNGHP
jgi:hypothetical protein